MKQLAGGSIQNCGVTHVLAHGFQSKPSGDLTCDKQRQQ
jgi:hypothetical protein